MTGVFVVDESSESTTTCRAILGYRNALPDATVSGQDEDDDYPLSNAFDHSYNSEYSTNDIDAPTDVEMVFSFTSQTKLSYFGINSKNASDCGLSVVVEVLPLDTGVYEEVAGFGSMTNAKPVMVYFGDLFDAGYANALNVRITLTYTSKPYIMSMFCGEAIAFPRSFSLGFQPAHMTYLDEVEQFFTDEGLNLIPSRRISKGKQLKGSINYVRIALLDLFWDEFFNHVLDSKTMFMMWNHSIPEQVIYGSQNPQRITKPSYKTNLFSQIEFEIVGWA